MILLEGSKGESATETGIKEVMNRTIIKKAALALAIMGGSGAFALAQQSSQDASSQDTSSSGGAQNNSLQQAQSQEFFRSSTIVGKTAQDSKGQKLGSVKDIVFNQQGEIFAFVDIGNGKWAAVPWQVVNPNSAKGKDNVVLNTTQQQLKSAPSVSKDQWGSLNNPAFAQGVYSYYQVQPPTAVGGASSPGSRSSSSSQGQGSTSSTGENSQQSQTQQQQPQSSGGQQ